MDSVGEGEGGKIWENGIETCEMSCMKRDASPGSKKKKKEKAEEPEIKLPTFAESWRKQRCSRKTSTSAFLTTLKPLTVWITTNCGKFLNRWNYQATLPVS